MQKTTRILKRKIVKIAYIDALISVLETILFALCIAHPKMTGIYVATLSFCIFGEASKFSQLLAMSYHRNKDIVHKRVCTAIWVCLAIETITCTIVMIILDVNWHQ